MAKRVIGMWELEFGKAYAVPERISSAAGIVDVSWHNDVCPSFQWAGFEEFTDLRLWVEEPEPGEGPRFWISRGDDQLFETNDEGIALSQFEAYGREQAQGKL